GSDDVATSQTAAWLIHEKKLTRLGFIGVTDRFAVGMRRRCAFQAAMHALLDLPSPTAVFAFNDLMAIGAMEAIRQRGLRIPEDIAIVGFGNIPAASWIFPKLTTVAQYPDEMGRAMAAAVFER